MSVRGQREVGRYIGKIREMSDRLCRLVGRPGRAMYEGVGSIVAPGDVIAGDATVFVR